MMYIAALFMISLLVIIHEFGHYIVARAFGMRVLTYSIGFGPVLARWRPKGSETVFQIAVIPVLAYVQIAGMNPREENDPNDRGSYQNATPLARFLTIAAGPLANFLAASVVIFAISFFGGEPVASPAQIGQITANSPAAAAGLRPNDRVQRINGNAVHDWQGLVERLNQSQRPAVTTDARGVPVTINGEATPTWPDVLRVLARTRQARPIHVAVARGGDTVELDITPRYNAELRRFLIGVGPSKLNYQPVGFAASMRDAVVRPTEATAELVHRLGDLFSVQLVGPVGIVSMTVSEAEKGWRDGLVMIVGITLNLFIFNLLPIPALDGGRLLVLGYEMVTRRRPNPKIEARVLGYSLVLMLGLFLVVTSREIWGLITGLIARSRG